MNLYCKVFIDTDSEYNDLFEIISDFIHGQKQAVSFIISDWCSINVNRNKEHIRNSSDFLYWKYYLDIDPETSDETLYINCIKQLTDFLKASFSGAVCACDFEELL